MNKPYTLNDVKKDLEKIQATVTHTDNEFFSEFFTLLTPGDAKRVFKRLSKMVKPGQGVQLIVHKVIK